MVEYTIEVNGMSCTGCERVLRQKLIHLQDINDVNSDANENEVVIYGNPSVEERARKIIAETGYEPVE